MTEYKSESQAILGYDVLYSGNYFVFTVKLVTFLYVVE